MYCCFKRALRILEHSVARSSDHNALTIFGGSVQVGDLVRVKLPSIQPYIGLAIKANDSGGVLVRSIDGRFQYWVNSWSGKVINASG